MVPASRSLLRSRARFWYTLSLIVAATLLVLVGARGVMAAPPPSPTPVRLSDPYRATPIPLPAVPPQRIQIDSPPEQTVVGSPMTITGRLDRFPRRGVLIYRVVSEAGGTLGDGTFPVTSIPGEPVMFGASISFRLPPAGGPIRLELFDRDQRSDAPIALTTLSLYVARPQAIIIDSPAPGTTSNGSVEIKGQTARLPMQARLLYTVSASDGRLLGSGDSPVAGSPELPAFFQVNVSFTPPPEGDNVTVVIYDRDPASEAVIASASVTLVVAPQPQRILFDNPAEGTRVGSPVTITGRTVRYPAQGTLGYTITDSRGTQVGSGAFPVPGSLQTGGNFVASLGFAYPPQGGPLRIELYDKAADGSLRATTTLQLRVAPLLTPTPQPTAVPPSATPGPTPSGGDASPVALLAAFYDAINRGDYGKAYNAWLTPPGNYVNFARGYLDTLSVQLVVEPPLWIADSFGNLHAAVPAGLVAQNLDGGTTFYAGCYKTVAARPAQGNQPVWKLSEAAIEEIDSGQELVATMDRVCATLGLPLPGDARGNTDGRSDEAALLGSYYRAINRGDYDLAYSYWAAPPSDYESFVAAFSATTQVRVFVQPLAPAGQEASLLPTALLLSKSTGEAELAAGCTRVRRVLTEAGPRWALSASTVQQTAFGPSISDLLATACTRSR